MISPNKIRQKAEKLYGNVLHQEITGSPFVCISLAVGPYASSFVQFRDEIDQLHAASKARRGYGYSVVVHKRHLKPHGLQTLPVKITIETRDDFLRLIEKEQEFVLFCLDIALIRTCLPRLLPWAVKAPMRVIKQHGSWTQLLSICDYFLDHPRPQCYMRALPVPLSTKFLEQHCGILQELLTFLLPAAYINETAKTFEERFGLKREEPSVRVRFLDNQLEQQYHLPLSDLRLPLSQFATLQMHGQKGLIVENKMTLLALPPLTEMFALFGEGYKINGRLSQIAWLQTCPLFYWGDLDAHGFDILSQLRGTFPQIISLLMDTETFRYFENYCIDGEPFPEKKLNYLTNEEQELFLYLAHYNKRVEQEHISYPFALKKLADVCGVAIEYL